jgi:hypothetical protein
MKSLYYLYYRLLIYYRKGDGDEKFAVYSTYIGLTGLLWINICTVIFFASTVIGENLFDIVFTESSEYNRFIITPLLLAPIIITLYLLINKRIKHKIIQYDLESPEEKRKNGKKVLIYVVISVLMFFLSITSPLYL